MIIIKNLGIGYIDGLQEAINSNSTKEWLKFFYKDNCEDLSTVGCKCIAYTTETTEKEGRWLHIDVTEDMALRFIIQDINMEFNFSKDVFSVKEDFDDIEEVFFTALKYMIEASNRKVV